MTTPIVSVVTGDNSDLILEVSRLYTNDQMKIADLTYGKGVFWRKTPHLDVVGSDIMTVPERPYDLRHTPYKDGEFDIVVIDPPYIHSPGNHPTNDRYQNAETTKGFLHKDIRKLYLDGMMEAKRILKPTGQVWVKCKDQVQSSVQRWSHVEMLEDARTLGMYGRDLFILVPDSRTSSNRWENQYHARKVHSYLWIFDKTPPKAASRT